MIDNRIETIKHRLTQKLQPSYLEVIDDSELHRGHAGAQGGAGHYTVIIAANEFKGKTPIACHRLIYAILDDMIPEEIHALRIKIKE